MGYDHDQAQGIVGALGDLHHITVLAVSQQPEFLPEFVDGLFPNVLTVLMGVI